MGIQIPFPCTKSLEDFQSTEKGFFCGDCQHHIIDLRNPKQAIHEKGSCVIIHEEENEQTIALKKTYRFALALFIVMGSNLIVNNSVKANQLLNHVNELREIFIAEDSAKIYLNGTVSDEKGRAVKPVKITITLENGKVIEKNAYGSRISVSSFWVELPIEQLNKNIIIKYEYFGDEKELTVLVNQSDFEIPIQTFKRNRKDRFSKKRYPKRIFVGKFKF